MKQARTSQILKWRSLTALAPTLIHANDIVGLPIAYLPFIVLALAAIVSARPRAQRFSNHAQVPSMVFWLAMMFTVISIAFSPLGSLLAPVTIALYAFAAMYSAKQLIDMGRSDAVVPAILISLPIYVSFLALRILVDNGGLLPLGYGNTLLGLLGIQAGRVQSANYTGVLSGLSLVALAHLWIARAGSRILIATLLLASAYVIVLSDARGSAVAAALCIAVYLTFNRGWMRILTRLMFVATLTSPVWLYSLFNWFNNENIDILGRGGEVGIRLGAGTGRPVVWEAAFNELAEFKVQHLFGYGLYGHVNSGISFKYQWIFPQEIEPHTLHSFTLQTIIDSGYVGLALISITAWLAISGIFRRTWMTDLQAKALFACLIFIYISGLTEITGTAYYFDMFLVTIGIYALSVIKSAVPAAAVQPALSSRTRMVDARLASSRT